MKAAQIVNPLPSPSTFPPKNIYPPPYQILVLYHSELRYPSMAGFPIVSLGSLVGSYEACEVLIPQFEIDEYYMRDETIGKQAWSGRYPTAVKNNYIKKYIVEPNNLKLSSGEMSSINYSGDFMYNENQSYSIVAKFNKIKFYRIDSFFVTSFEQYGFYWFMYNWQNNSVYSDVVEIRINIPNIKDFGEAASFSSVSKSTKVYINAPNAVNTGLYFLRYTQKMRYLYLNTPSLSKSRGGTLIYSNTNNIGTTVRIYSTTENETSRLYSLLNGSKGDYAATLYKGGTCSLSEFDIRYWDLWQNESGSDC